MRRRNNLIVVLMLLALLVLIAAPATAAKGGDPGPPDPEPPGPFDGMCTEQVIDIDTAPTLTGTLDCVDVFSDEDTAWEFEVVITGKRPWGIKSVYLSVREAHPGDFCWIWSGDPQLLDQDPGQDISFTVITDEIPASEKEACSEDGGAFDDPTESMVVTLRTTGTKKDATTVVTIRP